MEKTIIFCVDQEHADEMRRAIQNLNSDICQKYPDYVVRITADEGSIGRGKLSDFQDVETAEPVIVTTSKLLTTGVDIPTCKNIVLARVVNSMTEFKQMIGRGTRVRDDYGKLYFNILDYTGSATRLFADPAFDGDPVELTQEEIDALGNVIEGSQENLEVAEQPGDYITPPPGEKPDKHSGEPPHKYYYDGGQVAIIQHVVYELDITGKQLSVVKLTDYAGKTVRTLYPNAVELRQWWADPRKRGEIIQALANRGIEFNSLAEAANQPEADPFDLLCYLAYSAPLRTCRERADRVRREEQAFFGNYSPSACHILEELLGKYAEYGTAEFKLPETLRVPPITEHGNVQEIAALFGGANELKIALEELQTLIYK